MNFIPISSKLWFIFVILMSLVMLAAVKVELTLTMAATTGVFFPSFPAAFWKTDEIWISTEVSCCFPARRRRR